MRHEFGSFEEPGVLTPTIAVDIGVRSRQRRILAAMAKSCANKTFATTTIADIVENASISRATFYKHFANKRECFEAAVEFFTAQMSAVAAEAYATGESPPEALRKAIAALLDLFAANPTYAKLLLIEVPATDPKLINLYRGLAIEALEAQWGSNGRAGPNPVVAFGRAQVLMAEYVASGRIDQFPNLLPEFLYIALLPLVGQEEALKQAARSQ